MKNSTDKPLHHRRLVFRRETITVLTPPELSKIAGGTEALPCTYFSGCHPTLAGCVTEG
jgi:hypothetical protein